MGRTHVLRISGHLVVFANVNMNAFVLMDAETWRYLPDCGVTPSAGYGWPVAL